MFAVDVETTGTIPGYHEIIQIAVVPLNKSLIPDGVSFYTNIRPQYPERADSKSLEINGLSIETLNDSPDSETVIDRFLTWVDGRKLVPLAHSWPFEYGFLRAWLGNDLFNEVWHYKPRDAMAFATMLNDLALLSNRPIPFERVGLKDLCKRFGVVNTKPHDALADSIAEAEVYRRLLQSLCG